MTALLPRTFTYHDRAYTVVVPSEMDHIGRAIAQHQTFYEMDVLEAIRAALAGQQGFAVVDAGAFVGNHTLFFATQLGAARVVSCEPSANAYACLQQTIARNGLTNVDAVNVALGEQAATGVMQIHTTSNEASNTLATEGDGARIPVERLDAVVARTLPAEMRIGLIKIDVEGAEAAVLRGATATITRHRPLLCVELHTDEAMRTSLALLPGYVVGAWGGSSPTFLIRPTTKTRLLVSALNQAWVWALRFNRRGWAWRLQQLTAKLAG